MKARNLSLSLTFFGILLCLLAAAVALTDAGQVPAAQAAAPASVLASDVMTQPAAAPVLLIALQPSADRPAWGEVFTYTLVMRNTGDAVAAGAAMTNALPDGLTYVSGTLQATSGAAEYQAAERTIRWQGDLALNAAVTLTYAAQLLTQDYIYNTAVLTHPLAAASAGATTSPADEWGAPEVVAEGRVFDYKLASYRNIAVDSQGRPRIAYGGETGLYYATFANGAWTSMQVPVTPTRPTKAALVLDPQDRALIAFYDDIWGYIWVAREISPTANIWSLEQVSSKYFGSNFMERVDIQLDNAGRLHLVYYDGDAPSGHYYTVHEGGAWHAPALAVASSTCAFALDENDIPHLACKESAYLRLYTYTGASPWSSFEQVAAGLDDKAIYAPSLAYAGTAPHVAFLRRNNGLYHATKSGSWTTTQVDFSPWNSGAVENTPMVSAAEIRGGQIAIAYAWRWYPAGSSAHTETIRLATRPLTSTAWITESVDSVSDVSWSQDWARPSLALDSVGRAHLAYFYLPNQTLRHAAQTGSFTHYTVDENSTLGGNAGIDVGSDGSVHVAYFSAGLRHAYSLANTTTWTKTLVAAGLDGDTTPIDLAVDAANTPHLVYQSNSLLLHHAILSGAAWSTRTIDAPGVRTNPALDADAGGTAHAAYLALEGANLVVRHAAFAGATWTPKTLAIAGPPGHTQSPQLVAQGGKVYVLYADCTAYHASGDYPITLTLQTLADGAWHRQSLHSFTGQCGGRLDYQLLGDSAGRLAAVVTIQDAADQITSLTLWLEGSEAETAQRTLDVERTTWRSDGVRAPLGGVTIVKPISQVRGDGLETLNASGGQKRAIYQDRSGAKSAPVNLAQMLDSSTALKDLACYGQNAAALERSYTRNALAVERARPRPRPANWANATKSATPAAVYAYEIITYTIRLYWRGNEPAPIAVQEDGLDVSAGPDPRRKAAYWGGLSWGNYISRCEYDPAAHTIRCSGEFPASETVLETYVTFAAKPTCLAYQDGSPYESVAQVGIGGYYFTPAARTALKAPFQLRASTPRFVPKNRFAPGHTALLYTVSKGDEPIENFLFCRFDAYTRLTLPSGSGLPQPMRNDGQNPDFHADDRHHSAWANLAYEEIYQYDLYVAAAGQPFAKAILAHTLSIPFVWPESPQLVVLTDLEAMFNEWHEIGLHRGMVPDSQIRDRDQNWILDYYDAVERIRQYAANEDGVVIDVARDAYNESTRWTGFYSSFANRFAMGNQIDAMVSKLPRTVKNVAILGTDAVVPYARIGVLEDARSEVSSVDPSPNLTTRDMADQTLSNGGTWMSDIPYGTFATARPNLPRLNMGVGRVFRDTPLDLITLLDRMETPLNVGRSSRAWVINSRQFVRFGNYSQEAERGIIPTLSRYLGRVNKITLQPQHFSGQYASGMHWLDGDVLLQPGDTVWDDKDIQVVKNQSDLLVFIGPGNKYGFHYLALHSLSRPQLKDGRFGLAFSAGDYNGLLPSARGNRLTLPDGSQASKWHEWWFSNAALDAKAALVAPSAQTLAAYNLFFQFAPNNYYHQMYSRFLSNLYYDWDETIGQAQVGAHRMYAPTSFITYDDNENGRVLYTTLLTGLPTQRLERSASAQASVARLAEPLAAPAAGVGAVQASQSITRSVVLSHFETLTDAEGRVAFMIPNNGYWGGQSYGPVLPMVEHSYILPAEAADIHVTLTFSQSHTLGPVMLAPLTMVVQGQPMTGTRTLTNPYPETVLAYEVYTDTQRTYLNISLIPQQYNPDTEMVTLYDRLDYAVSYNAPVTYTLCDLLVNNGAAVDVDQAALPITVTLNATQPFSDTLYWAIHDVAGLLLDVGHTQLDIATGVYQIGLESNTLGWNPGPKQVIVFLAADPGAGEETALASAHTLFTVRGRSLELERDKVAYGASDTSAALTTTVRDETGAPVSGLTGSLGQQLDGAPLALSWQGSGIYTAALDLGSVFTGQHFISVTLDGRVAEKAFIVDRQPPTSTLTGPSVVAAPTFTVTLSGDDDLSGVGEYVVQYRIGAGGAWTDWLTRTVGWDYTSGGAADPTLTFGPTEPVALQPGQAVHFRTRAVDVAGNREAEHSAADLSVTYGAAERTIYLPLVMRQ
jgi:uncharacterized repeat protein (TIGR01451 family)